MQGMSKYWKGEEVVISIRQSLRLMSRPVHLDQTKRARCDGNQCSSLAMTTRVRDEGDFQSTHKEPYCDYDEAYFR